MVADMCEKLTGDCSVSAVRQEVRRQMGSAGRIRFIVVLSKIVQYHTLLAAGNLPEILSTLHPAYGFQPEVPVTPLGRHQLQ